MQAEALEGVRPFASLYFFPSVPDAADRFPCVTEAESLAVTCLLDGHINYEQLRLLMEMLPGEKPARASGQPVPAGEPAKSFTTGAYVYSDVCGLRANARCFPATSMLLASVVSEIFPHDSFSAVALFRNIATPLHSDDNNELECDNLLLPCSHFENGQIWIEGTGSVPCPLDPSLYGSLLETSGGPAQFNARLRHATCGWTGLRLMLVAFQVRNIHTLPADDRDTLCRLAFQPCRVAPEQPSACARQKSIADSCAGQPSTDIMMCDDSSSPPGVVDPASSPDQCVDQPVLASSRDECMQAVFPARRSPLVIEVFAGTAVLSSACMHFGFRTLAVDRASKQSRFPIQTMDLTQEHDLNMLLDIIRQERAEIALVHLAPPCGTASAARSIPAPQLDRVGFRAPRPLRSVQYPMGLPNLEGQDLLRVTAANTLYAAVGRIAQVATSFDIRVTVENPANSLAWLCDGMHELLYYPGASEVLFDHCMHGGTRDKCTRWWCNDNFFDSLALRCSKDHPHASWKPRFNASGIDFPTHHEAAYPTLLCERIASLLADAHPAVTALRPRPATQVFLDKQPRYARPLVSNYAGYDTWAVPLSRDSWAELILPLYPKGCKVLRRKLVPWGRVRVCAKSVCPLWDQQAIASWNVKVKLADSDQHCDMDFDSLCEEAATNKVVALIFPNECRPIDDMVELLCFGIPREPDDFVRHAVMAGHPRNLLQDAVDGPAKTVAECVLVGKREREQLVDKTVAAWKSIKEGCAADNAKLLLQGPDHVRKVLANKNVLFWRDILNSLDFSDVDLWRDLRQGFRLTGWMPASGVFPKRLRPPALTKDELLAQSAYRTPLTVSSIAKGAKDDVAKAAWAETKAEIEKGWIFLDSSYDPLRIILSRRFGLQQRDKTRVIDDGKASGLNLLCGLIEHFTLHGVDVIAATLICLLKLARERKGRLLGKTYDLVSAYKQFPVHDEDRKVLRTGVLNTDTGDVAVFGSNVLSFGATGSVAGFLRISAALWHAGVQGLAIPWLAYYDDFPVFAFEDEAECVERAADALFDLMGVEYAKEGKKSTSFGTSVSALGLVFDLTDFSKGNVTIRHTERRAQELRDTLEYHLSQGTLSPKEAEVLRGRLHWYSSYLFGRGPAVAMKTLSRRAQGREGSNFVNDELRGALGKLLDHVENAPPLRINVASGRTFFLFTDGSYEPSSDVAAGIGGILYDDAGMPVSFFSGSVHPDDLDAMLETSSHPIYEIELYAVLVAFQCWGHLLKDSFTVAYIDNSAAQAALVAGSSGTDLGSRIVELIGEAESKVLCRPWYSWLPTHSNPADPPSRGEFEALIKQGAERVLCTQRLLSG